MEPSRDPYAPSAYQPTMANPAPYAPPAYVGDDDRERSMRPSPKWTTWWSSRSDLSHYAFLAGLLGGVLILVGAFVVALAMTFMAVTGSIPDGWWVGDERDDWLQAAVGIVLWGLLTGGLVLAGALTLKSRQGETALPGGLMLIGGLLSFFALGGFLIGGLVAILGGVLAIAGADRIGDMGARRAPPRPL